MARKKSNPEADTGVPDVSTPAEPKAVVKAPSPLAEDVEDVVRRLNKIVADPRFPSQLGAEASGALSQLKVIQFKVRAI